MSTESKSVLATRRSQMLAVSALTAMLRDLHLAL
jgi:hypothetical protein